jgi:hypothetical protein
MHAAVRTIAVTSQRLAQESPNDHEEEFGDVDCPPETGLQERMPLVIAKLDSKYRATRGWPLGLSSNGWSSGTRYD